MTDSLTRNSRAVVTGAGSGIGRAFALELARRGGRVVCADLDQAAAVGVHNIDLVVVGSG